MKNFCRSYSSKFKRLPIVNFEFNQDLFIQKADLMLELNKKLQELNFDDFVK